MANVFKIPFEVVGDGLKIAKEFYAERDAVRKAQLDIATKLGGKGVRPGRDGSIRSVIFEDDIPYGFRRIAVERCVLDGVPHKGRKAGRAASRAIAEAPRIPSDESLAIKFGWDRDWVCDGTKIYFPTVTRLTLPSERILITFPVEADKPWSAPDTLREIKESEYLAAFAAHNAEVEKRKAA